MSKDFRVFEASSFKELISKIGETLSIFPIIAFVFAFMNIFLGLDSSTIIPVLFVIAGYAAFTAAEEVS